MVEIPLLANSVQFFFFAISCQTRKPLDKAELLQEGIIFLKKVFARAILLIKIDETKVT